MLFYVRELATNITVSNILVHVPRYNTSSTSIVISGYAADGGSLPLNGNVEMTETGVRVRWLGEQMESRHDVILSVKDAHAQTAICSFTVILQGSKIKMFVNTCIKSRKSDILSVSSVTVYCSSYTCY